MPAFKKTRLFFIFLLCGLLIYLFSAAAQTPTPYITGHLLKKQTWNNYGCTVNLYQNQILLATSKTALNGSFGFYKKLPAGNYQLYFFDHQYYLGKQEISLPKAETKTLRFSYYDQQQKPLYLVELLGLLLAVFLILYSGEILKRFSSRAVSSSFIFLAATIILFNSTEFLQVFLASLGQEVLAANIFTLKHLGLTWFGSAFLYFVLNFPKRSPLLKKPFLSLLFCAPLLEIILVLSWSFLGSDFLFEEVWHFSFASLRFFIVAQLLLLMSLAAGYLFINKKRETNLLIKSKFSLLFNAALAFFLLLLAFVIIPVLFFNGHSFFPGQYPLAASLAGILLLATINLTVTKYRFSAREGFIDQALIYSFFNFFMVVIFSAGLVFVESSFLRNNNYLLRAYSLFFLLLTAFLFKEKTRKQFDRFFYGDQIKQRQILTEVTPQMLAILNKKEICAFLKKILQQHLEQKKITVFTTEKKKPPLGQKYLSQLDPEFDKLCRADQETEVIVPLQNQHLLGYIFLGCRSSGLPYKERELELICALAAQAALAINNAGLTESLVDKQKELEQSARLASLGTLAAGFAHEIKNPLTVLSNLMALYPQNTKDKEFLTTFQEMVPRQLTRINLLVQNILNFARPSDSKKSKTNLAELLEKNAQFLKIPASKKNIELRCQISCRPIVKASAKELDQVLLNLTLNAIEATPVGGKISFNLNCTEQTVLLEIADTGKGIAKKDLPHIFEPFFTKKATGTGLGLSIVYSIIERHLGKITVASQKNKGTTFTISLPRQ